MKDFFHKPFFHSYKTLSVVWLLIAVFSFLKIWNFGHGSLDMDYQIFIHSFDHAQAALPLYPLYPEDLDVYLYGPLFALLIAPFSLMPSWIGQFLFLFFLSASLFFTIRCCWLTKSQKVFILWFCAQEALTCILDAETNGLVLSGLLLTFYFVEKEKDSWAGLCIAVGALTKIFGLGGLVFFLFSRHKLRFAISTVLWMAFFFILPMFVWGPDYVVNQTTEWLKALSKESTTDLFAYGQNISLLGIIRKVSGIATYSDIWLMMAGLLAFLAPLVRIRQYGNLAYREAILSSALMFICLFSVSTESYGYILAMTGVAIWYVTAPWKRSGMDLFLLIFALFLTSFSYTDICPNILQKSLIRPYALKALPVCLIWFKLCWEVLTRDYSKPTSVLKE